MPSLPCRFFCLALLTSSLSLHARSQSAELNSPAHKINALDAAHAHDMLHDIYNDVRKNYYDPTFHGVDFDHSYHEADGRIDAAGSNGDAFRLIAGFLDSLHDSHLFFLPRC